MDPQCLRHCPTPSPDCPTSTAVWGKSLIPTQTHTQVQTHTCSHTGTNTHRHKASSPPSNSHQSPGVVIGSRHAPSRFSLFSRPMSFNSATRSLTIQFLEQKQRLDDFPGGSDGKESACNAGDPGSIPLGKIPWRRKWKPTPVFLPEESHGQRSLAGYSPWGHKEMPRVIFLFFSHPMSFNSATRPLVTQFLEEKQRLREIATFVRDHALPLYSWHSHRKAISWFESLGRPTTRPDAARTLGNRV